MQETANQEKAGHLHAKGPDFCMQVGACCHAPGCGEVGEQSARFMPQYKYRFSSRYMQPSAQSSISPHP